MFFDDVGQPCRIVGFTGEITPRKLIEEELRRSETYLAEAQRLSQTGSFGWSPTSGELFWSEETFRIFEYDRATKPTVELLLERVHPEDTVLVKQTIERASQDANDFDFEHRLLMPDASVKYLRVVAHAVSDESNAIEEGKDPNALKATSCFVGAVMDVTESKQAEEALRQDERELRQLIDFLPQLVMVLVADGNLILVNQMVVDYTGYTMREMREMGTDERRARDIHPDDLERALSEWQRGLASEAPFELERRARGKDGRYRWFLFRHKPLLDKEGRVARWFVTATDIEERKQEEPMKRAFSGLNLWRGPDRSWRSRRFPRSSSRGRPASSAPSSRATAAGSPGLRGRPSRRVRPPRIRTPAWPGRSGEAT